MRFVPFIIVWELVPPTDRSIVGCQWLYT